MSHAPVPPVAFDAALGLGLLRTPNSLYALRIGADGSPRHLYWGAPLDAEAVADLPVRTSPALSSFEADPEPDELGVESGARFGPAGLQVRFADGTRGAQWHFAGAEADEKAGELRLRLTDRRFPLTAVLCYRVRPDSEVIERWVELTNEGTAPIRVGRLDSAAWAVPACADYRLSHLVGGWNSEFQLERTRLPVAETVLTSRRGLTSHHANPWLALDDGTATEEQGRVWSTALAWSGSWRTTVHRDPVGRVCWTGGFGHEGLEWRLRPAETLTTPVFAGLYTDGGFGAASRAWHAHLRAHVLPHPAEDRPVLYNSWEAAGFDVDLPGQLRLAALAAPLGVELFVLDDGWFGGRRGTSAGLGDWSPYPGAFPDGLRPLADEVHRLGMRFGLWVEPEMVNRDSDLYRAHPDWVVHSPAREATELREQLMLNFARPDVAAWAHATLDRLVRENGVDLLKWDANRAVTEAGRPGSADPDRLWIDHVRAVYRIMDRLRADHPGLRIEACAGGGGRADLGVLARTDQAWTSDNTDPVDRLGIQHGFGQLFPATVMGAWVTDSPNPATGRVTPLRFRFHVAMAGALGLGGDLRHWSARELAEAADLVAQYKRIRPLVQRGVAHRLAAPGGVTAVHYAAPDGDEHAVLAWRPTTRFGHAAPPLPLPALSPDADYLDPDRGLRHRGAQLLHHGLDLHLPPGDAASSLTHLRRVPR